MILNGVTKSAAWHTPQLPTRSRGDGGGGNVQMMPTAGALDWQRQSAFASPPRLLAPPATAAASPPLDWFTQPANADVEPSEGGDYDDDQSADGGDEDLRIRAAGSSELDATARAPLVPVIGHGVPDSFAITSNSAFAPPPAPTAGALDSAESENAAINGAAFERPAPQTLPPPAASQPPRRPRQRPTSMSSIVASRRRSRFPWHFGDRPSKPNAALPQPMRGNPLSQHIHVYKLEHTCATSHECPPVSWKAKRHPTIVSV